MTASYMCEYAAPGAHVRWGLCMSLRPQKEEWYEETYQIRLAIWLWSTSITSVAEYFLILLRKPWIAVKVPNRYLSGYAIIAPCMFNMFEIRIFSSYLINNEGESNRNAMKFWTYTLQVPLNEWRSWKAKSRTLLMMFFVGKNQKLIWERACWEVMKDEIR